MLFFNHSSAESVSWVHLFSYDRESKVSERRLKLIFEDFFLFRHEIIIVFNSQNVSIVMSESTPH